MERRMVTIDGNEAAAYVAHQTNDVIAIYPITPSSPMGELADAYAAAGKPNIWGTVPLVMEMQSEGGAAGTVHGALQTGSLTTTFTASQGLLLMIPNMYKIAGELSPTVFHVAARSLATQALSIFGDHSDVMATRQTGFAMLASNSVQEAMDFALISQAATLESRVPFLHFFDGFRTSHEVMKVEELSTEDIRAMIDDELVRAHRDRGLTPDRPVIRGTAQNPDVYFQGREASNTFYLDLPDIVQKTMDKFSKLVGRQYHLFDYVGAPDAERVIVLMGSGAETVHETVDYLVGQGEKVGVLKVRLYRPFSISSFVDALPQTVQTIAVLDRTKEPGGIGEPMYLDVVSAMQESDVFENKPKIVGGRYGLSSKEFTPAMVKGVFDELAKPKPKNHFTVGIVDDVTQTHLDYDRSFSTEGPGVFRGMFFGLGADGTVGANKNSIKIIGEYTDNFAQGYFVYDSKKSGAITTSHLRFGDKPIKSAYLIDQADFVACHQSVFLEKYDMLRFARKGATFLLNTSYGPGDVWHHLPRKVQEDIVEKELNLYVVDAYEVARKTGMGQRINTVMQTCFFALSGVLPEDEAIGYIQDSIRKTYGKKGDKIVQMNFDAVEQSIENLYQIEVPDRASSAIEMLPPVPDEAPDFVKRFTAPVIAGLGDDLPVSAMPVDGTFPTATTQWEKRNIALEVPVWDLDVCIQCNKCALICPHACIRPKVYDEAHLDQAPDTFKSMDVKSREFKGMKYTLQVAVEDCTGCGLCVHFCPAKNKSQTSLKAINMAPQEPIRDLERENYQFFLDLPELDRRQVKMNTVRDSQLLEPLFEFSGACAGCGETPYLKLVSQFFGDRAVVANATGCSSIYGGNLPTTPWAVDGDGRGPAWSNSLFEDNAEFGLGFRLSLDKRMEYAKELVKRLADILGSELADGLLNAVQKDEADIFDQRARVVAVKEKLANVDSDNARELLSVADALVKKSVWIVGGDGWAYDIGFGGLDHVMASGRNVNILVLDTEVYSNTGGQMSKATPRGAVAKFAAGGKAMPKKDLGLIAMSYGNVYVARVAMGANDMQTVRALLEAEAYDGPSIVIAYSQCIAHGINMSTGTDQQKAAVDSGHWVLMRYNPDRALLGENPLVLDSKTPKMKFKDYALSEARYNMLARSKPEASNALMTLAQQDVDSRWRYYEQMASMHFDDNGKADKSKA
ncbi:MAG: pyruvate-ferredoxin/flavodoxin oxidoreductase [Candidatus Latescibacterota bacterium]|jgi:pyruvate-ferredoxin/flavodoxin oxidoreductase